MHGSAKLSWGHRGWVINIRVVEVSLQLSFRLGVGRWQRRMCREVNEWNLSQNLAHSGSTWSMDKIMVISFISECTFEWIDLWVGKNNGVNSLALDVKGIIVRKTLELSSPTLSHSSKWKLIVYPMKSRLHPILWGDA